MRSGEIFFHQFGDWASARFVECNRRRRRGSKDGDAPRWDIDGGMSVANLQTKSLAVPLVASQQCDVASNSIVANDRSIAECKLIASQRPVAGSCDGSAPSQSACCR